MYWLYELLRGLLLVALLTFTAIDPEPFYIALGF